MKNITKYAPLFIITAAVLWAIDGIVLTPNLYSIGNVGLVVFIMHGLAFLLMFPFALKKLKVLKSLKPADWGVFLWIALFGGALGTMFITKALFYVNFVNLSIVILIQKLQPIFALLLAALILKERLPKKFWTWAGLAIVATYFITFADLVPNFDTGDKTIIASLFALGAAFAWGSSTVFGKRALKIVDYQVATYMRFGLTTLIMFFIVATTTGFGDIVNVTQQQWWVFLVIVFTSGAAAMLIYYYGLNKVKASEATIYELAFPISAIFLEMAIHQKFLTATQWLGAVMLMFAIYKITKQKS